MPGSAESEEFPMSDNPDTSRQDAIRTARKEIVRSSVLALAALGVIVFACYAWFVSSSSVSATGMSASIKGSAFELASIGSESVFETPVGYEAEDGAAWEHNNSRGTHTAGKDVIVWQLDSSSHLNNIESIESGERGIRPGSFGTLQFYVIPKVSESLSLKFELELLPILNTEMNITDTEKENLDKLLHGHMLFSYQCAANTNPSAADPTLIDIREPSFTLNFEEVTEDQPILVTMKWIWPYVLGDIQKGNLQGVCSKESVISLMNTLPSYFFYHDGNTVAAPDLNNQSKVYHDYFNAADQFLGERLQWLIVRMTAQAA